MHQKTMVAMSVVVVTVGIASFFFGRATAPTSQVPDMSWRYGRDGMMGGQGRAGTQRTGTPGTGMVRSRPVSGEIAESRDGSLVVRLVDGSSKIILFSDSTVVTQSQTASPADLTVGSQVMVIGQENNDGSITAQSLQLNPQMYRLMAPEQSISPTRSDSL